MQIRNQRDVTLCTSQEQEKVQEKADAPSEIQDQQPVNEDSEIDIHDEQVQMEMEQIREEGAGAVQVHSDEAAATAEGANIWARLEQEQEARRIQSEVHSVRQSAAVCISTTEPNYPARAEDQHCPVHLNRCERLIGMSELYVREPQRVYGVICPMCRGRHPFFACRAFLSRDLVDMAEMTWPGSVP